MISFQCMTTLNKKKIKGEQCREAGISETETKK
jgi:hypothetical protein